MRHWTANKLNTERNRWYDKTPKRFFVSLDGTQVVKCPKRFDGYNKSITNTLAEFETIHKFVLLITADSMKEAKEIADEQLIEAVIKNKLPSNVYSTSFGKYIHMKREEVEKHQKELKSELRQEIASQFK